MAANYEQLTMNYEQCITRSGEQNGKIMAYERLLTNGLSTEINTIKSEQMWVIYIFP